MKRRIRQITAASLLGIMAVAATAPAQANERGAGRGHGPSIDFSAIDANGDSTLARDELLTRATAQVGQIDADGNGQITRAEIVEQMPQGRGGAMRVFAADPAEARADRMLKEMGATAAGEIAVADLAARRVDDLLARQDTNRDGALSQDETEARRGGHDRSERGMGGDGRGHD